MRVFTVCLFTLLLITMSSAQLVTIEVPASMDIKQAFEFANQQPSVDTVMFVTSGGVYTTVDTNYIAINRPLVVMAKPGLAEKPIVTNSDANASVDDIFRVFDDLTVIGLAFDGGNAISHGPKYAIRLSHSSTDSVKMGTNIVIKDCDFYDFFENKDPVLDGHAFKIDTQIKAGDVQIENCTFRNTGYEAIRISDTEKWATDGALTSLTIRNCTFTNIDAECIRYYSDLDAATPDAPLLIEHITINNSATRVMFLKNSGGAIVRDIIITNSRMSGHGRDADLFDAQGNTDVPSFVSHIDTFNVLPVAIKSSEGNVDTTTIYGFDPMYPDAANFDYTVLAYQLYAKSYDGTVLGDQRWIDETVSNVPDMTASVPVRYSLEQNYPNPFNPATTITYSIGEAGNVVLTVYDITGKVVATPVNAQQSAGTYSVSWQPAALSSGIYFYQLTMDQGSLVKKMMYIR